MKTSKSPRRTASAVRVQRVVSLHPQKRLAALAETLRQLHEWTSIEARMATIENARIWIDVRDWTIGAAKQHGISVEFLHGASRLENREDPAMDATPGNGVGESRGRPMQANAKVSDPATP